jgi:hypothetical protein
VLHRPYPGAVDEQLRHVYLAFPCRQVQRHVAVSVLAGEGEREKGEGRGRGRERERAHIRSGP